MKDQTEKLKREFSALGVVADGLSSDDFILSVEDGTIVCDLGKYDFIVWLNKDALMSEILEKSSYKLFNSSKAVEICDDKALTYAALVSCGVPLVDSVFAPVGYYGTDKDGFLKKVADKLGYPLVAKLRVGSMGEGVSRIADAEELKEFAEKVGEKPHFYQKFYGDGGKDVRVIVVGGKAIAAMRRVNDGDFRSNVACGGRGEKIEPCGEIKEIAEKCAAAIGLDYCGVDILESDRGYAVCEVNSNAFMKGITKVTGVNVARAYAEYIYKKIY